VRGPYLKIKPKAKIIIILDRYCVINKEGIGKWEWQWGGEGGATERIAGVWRRGLPVWVIR
jgi:hypothetical protein